jgi:hypothetical protein
MRDKKARIIYLTQTAAIDRILKEAEIAEYSSYTTLMELDLQHKRIQNSFQIIN